MLAIYLVRDFSLTAGWDRALPFRWDAYLTSMMTDATWSDHVIPHGAANCFETCIQVVSSHHNDVIICPEYDVTASNRLVLGHVHELHYVSLIPPKEGIQGV